MRSGATAVCRRYESPVKFSITPAIAPVTNAAKGRITVMIGSNKEYVSAIESTPLSGVEMRKARQAPLFAPCFLKPATAGTTPHDQRGMGIPRSDAYSTDLMRPR